MIPDPRPVRAPTIAAGVFAFDSAFPRPGISAYIEGVTQEVNAKGLRLTAFGHTDHVGSDDYNKLLADRRAESVLAVLTTDVERFERIYEIEQWGVAEHQAMMRTIGVDPGPPDGDAGDMTVAATRAFQKGYNLRLWFESYQTPRVSELEISGVLDELTKAAIRDAYVNYIGLPLAAGNLATVSFAGCGEYNPLSPAAAENRRVTLALFGGDGPRVPFPCVTGDAAACLIDGEGARQCRFYREHIDEPEEIGPAWTFFDDNWMPTPSLWAYMSAITTLPDGTPVTFEVYRTGGSIPQMPLDSRSDETPANLELVATVEGVVLCGIAFGVWHPADHFHAFDTRTWFDDAKLERTDAELVTGPLSPERLSALYDEFEAHVHYRPPVFKVIGGGQWMISTPPGRRLRALARDSKAAGDTLLMTPDGRHFSTRGNQTGLGREEKAVYLDFGRRMINDEAEDT